MNLGWQELILIVVIVLLLFGAKRVPEIFRALGSGIGQFKKGMKDESLGPPEDDAPDSSRPSDSHRKP
jgi:sec-independent protein translocase protein TatA